MEKLLATSLARHSLINIPRSSSVSSTTMLTPQIIDRARGHHVSKKVYLDASTADFRLTHNLRLSATRWLAGVTEVLASRSTPCGCVAIH